MTTNTSQKSEFHSYSMEKIPDGLYMDHNSGTCFVSARRLAKLVDEFEDTINEFIKADSALEEATEIAVIQTALGLRRIRLHPESTIKAVVKEYKPDLFIDLEGCNFDEFLDGLAKFSTDSSDEPQDTLKSSSRRRNWQAYPTKSIPEGIYMDANNGDIFVSTDLLARLAHKSSTAIHQFVESNPDRRDVAAFVPGVCTVRVHPESTVREVIGKYRSDLEDSFEGCAFLVFLNELANCSTDLVLDAVPSDTQTEWTLQEWMISYCEIPLEGRLFNQFKSKVHRVYKETYRRDPRTGYRPQANNPKQVARLQVYNPTEFPVLQLCYMRTLMEVSCS
jgi:hypothetical protein